MNATRFAHNGFTIRQSKTDESRFVIDGLDMQDVLTTLSIARSASPHDPDRIRELDTIEQRILAALNRLLAEISQSVEA